MSEYKLVVCSTDKVLKGISADSKPPVIKKEIEENRRYTVTWVSTMPFVRNTIEWEEEYLLCASEQKMKMDMNADVPFDTIAHKNPVCNFSSGIFHDVRRAQGVAGNGYMANPAMNWYHIMSNGLSQEVGETQD